MKDTKPVQLFKLSKCIVFFDFDNTITPFDILDDIIERFSVNKEWIKFEQAWQKGKIGSRDCLENQLCSVRIDKAELLKYLSGIKIDSSFQELCAMLKNNGMTPVILSDNFDFIIDNILKNNNIKDIKTYANSLRFDKDRVIPLFPYINRQCGSCGHCKKKNLLKENPIDKITIYIGDGISDTCAAEHSDLVFAKDWLFEYFRKKKRFCASFKNLSDVYNILWYGKI